MPYGKAEWALEDGEWPPSSCVFSILLDDFGTKPTSEKHDDQPACFFKETIAKKVLILQMVMVMVIWSGWVSHRGLVARHRTD